MANGSRLVTGLIQVGPEEEVGDRRQDGCTESHQDEGEDEQCHRPLLEGGGQDRSVLFVGRAEQWTTEHGSVPPSAGSAGRHHV